jgi:hypothetical protein
VASLEKEIIDGDGVRRSHWHSRGLRWASAAATRRSGDHRLGPVFSTRFKIGETCAAVLGGVGVAVSDIWEIKTGRRLKLHVVAI